MKILFIVASLITLASYLLHTYCHYQEHRGKKLEALGKRLSTIISIGYLAWGLMIFSDPIRMDLPSQIVLPIGLAIGGIGSIFLILSAKAKHGFEETNQLSTTGVYRIIRHPMYLGITLIHIGFPLAGQSLITLFSAILWLSMMLIWRYWEEQYLIEKFGQEYLDYQKKTLF